MQHTNCLPGCYSTRDLSIGVNGGKPPIYNADIYLRNGYTNSMFFPPPTPEQYLGYEKEILRQTMLKHEATFREQVHELHRVYIRQSELMREIKRRELEDQQLQLRTVQLNSCLSQNLPNYPQQTWHISVNSREPSSFIPVKSTEDSLKDCELLDPKGKRCKRKLLNLELPADEYIDSEEGECLGEEKVFEVPEVPLSEPKMAVFPKGDFELFSDTFSKRTHYLADLNEPICLEDGSSPNYFSIFGPTRDKDSSEKSTLDVQVLTEQHHLESHNAEAEQRRSNMNSPPEVSSSQKSPPPSKPLQHEHWAKISKASKSDKCDRKLWSETTHSLSETLKKCHDFSDNNSSGPVNSCIPASYQLVPMSDVPKYEPSSFLSQRKPARYSRENHIAVQALPCFNALVPPNKSSKNQSKCFQGPDFKKANTSKVMDLNFLPPSSFLETETSEQNAVKNLEDSIVGFSWLRAKPKYNGKSNKEREDFSHIDSAFSASFLTSMSDAEPKRIENSNGLRNEKSSESPNFENLRVCEKVDCLIDLNSCINEDEPLPTQSKFPSVVVKMRLERDFEAPVSPENQECSPPRGESEGNQLEICPLKPESEDPQEEQLVKMAAEAIVVISSSGSPRLFLENAGCDTLHWFADLVSSLNGEDDQMELSSDSSDYFEAMTLKLPEVNVEEYFSNSISKREGKTDSISSPNLSSKGRILRVRQRKDFQTEILPSLASLSRHEVTVDLQAIGGLVGARGPPLEIGPRRRNGSTRARRLVNISPSNMVEGVSGFSLSKPPSDCRVGWAITEGSLAGWGMKKRRRRCQRFPISIPPIIL